MVLTMALCGLWHGPSWTFVLWGTLHGIGLVIVSLWRRYGWRMPSLAGWALTMVFALLIGVIFRAGSLEPRGTSTRGSRSCRASATSRAPIRSSWRRSARLRLPASQDIVDVAERAPAQGGRGGAWLVMVAILVELGDREAYEFVYFQF